MCNILNPPALQISCQLTVGSGQKNQPKLRLVFCYDSIVWVEDLGLHRQVSRAPVDKCPALILTLLPGAVKHGFPQGLNIL